MSDFSRRTVVRGAAWTVPVVAVATQAPAFAVSLPPPPPPPNANLGNSCGNVGNTNNAGCGLPKTLQIPVTVNNTTGVDIVLQVTSLFVNNTNDTVPTAAGTGVFSGVSNIFETNMNFAEHRCLSVTQSFCAGGANGDGSPRDVDSIVVSPGIHYYFVNSLSTQSSSTFSAQIETQLLEKTTCTPIPNTFAKVDGVNVTSSDNCGTATV